MSFRLQAQIPSLIQYPVATCTGPGCPSTYSLPTHITASFIDSLNEVFYIGGRFNTIGSSVRQGLAAIDWKTGNLLPWNPIVNNGAVYAICKSGDTIFVGGTFTQINGIARNRIAAVHAVSSALSNFFVT
ncbi:MAG: hypothetical protein Fur0041_12120 [Bacteroidia bacterium]